MKFLRFLLEVPILAASCAANLIPVGIQALDTDNVHLSSDQQVILSGTRNIFTARDGNHGTDKVCHSIDGKAEDAKDMIPKMNQRLESEHFDWIGYADDVAEYSERIAEIADLSRECQGPISGVGVRAARGAAVVGSVLASVVFSHL